MKPYYVLLHRDSKDISRKRNLLYTISYVKSLGFSVLVIEQDIESFNENICKELNVDYGFIYNPGLFNRSWGFNCFRNFIDCDKVILADNDIILDSNVLLSLENLLDENDVLRPFNGVVNHYDEIDTDNFMKFGTISNKQNLVNIFNMSGGVCSFRVDSFYDKIKGFDERFEGWGGEDDEMHYHLQQTDLKICSYNNVGIHLFHTRNNNDGNWHSHYQENVKYIRDGKRNFGVDVLGKIDKYGKN